MALHIQCASPGNGNLLYLIHQANKMAKTKKVGLLLAEMTMSHVTSRYKIHPNVQLLEVNIHDSVKVVEDWIERNQLDAVYIEQFDAMQLQEWYPMTTEEAYNQAYDSFASLAERFSIDVHMLKRLNRRVAMRKDKRPRLTDLMPREQRVASVRGLYREAVYHLDCEEDKIEVIDLKTGQSVQLDTQMVREETILTK